MAKYALVTGGSRGIGRAVCITLAGMGYHVIINYRQNKAGAEETLRLADGSGELLAFDVSSSVETGRTLENWQSEHPREYIEVLVNNAGVRSDNLMVFMEEDDWSTVIRTNLDSFFNVTRPLLKNMLLKRYGRIVNIVSLSGLKGLPGQVNYAAAKAGVIGATKALAQEVGKKNITVNAVAPGFIRTDMTEGLDEKELRTLIPLNRFGTPGEVASVVGFLASDESSYITGEVISVNGGMY